MSYRHFIKRLKIGRNSNFKPGWNVNDLISAALTKVSRDNASAISGWVENSLCDERIKDLNNTYLLRCL